ncbi:transporter substrate-binding domain-containing protein [Kitasatospora arboriphila]
MNGRPGAARRSATEGRATATPRRSAPLVSPPGGDPPHDRSHPAPPPRRGGAALAAGSLFLTACSSSSSSSGSGAATPTSSVKAASADPSLAALVPADVKSGGKLTVATDASYAPNEFKDDKGAIVGMDVDLAKAIAAKLGLQADVQNADFTSIIPGIAAKKYQLGMSSFTDTKEREQTVDMITYFTAAPPSP